MNEIISESNGVANRVLFNTPKPRVKLLFDDDPITPDPKVPRNLNQSRIVNQAKSAPVVYISDESKCNPDRSIPSSEYEDEIFECDFEYDFASPESPRMTNCGKSIAEDLAPCRFPDDIKRIADDIYAKMSKSTHRKAKRKHMIFNCVAKAYEQMGLYVCPEDIASELGIRKTHMGRAVSKFSEAKTGYPGLNSKITAYHCIREYCDKLGISPYDPVLSLANSIIKKDPSLDELFPQPVAAGIIKYYLEIHGITIDNARIANCCDRSEATINSMNNKIRAIDNGV
jgi:hypothetical protein